jgi:hypothetical protein
MPAQKKAYQSVFDKEFKLDEKTKKAFAKAIKEAQKSKLDLSQHSQTIICGPEEFKEKQNGVSSKNKKVIKV